MAIMEEIRAAEDRPSSAEAAHLGALNAITVTVAQMCAAHRILGELAEEFRWDLVLRRRALRDQLDEADVTIGAIDARLLAVRKWEDIHDPDRVMSQLYLMEAATLVPLVETEHGIGFRDSTFSELVEFISELPW